VPRLDITPPRRISLAFCLTLVTAAGLYGLVLLAPGWLTLGDLGQLEADNRITQSRLENRIEYLETVRDTLKADESYASELAGLDLQEATPGEKRLTVDESLRLVPLKPVDARQSELPGTWTTRPAIAALANNDILKSTLLVIAAGMVLFAFTLLHESQADRLAHWGNRLRGRLDN
jgi:hypothetical protein